MAYMGALFDFKCTCDSTLVYVFQADAEKCIFVWTILSQTRRTPQVTSDAGRISAQIFWLFPKERRMLRKRDYLFTFLIGEWQILPLTDRKNSKQCPGKICRCSNSAFLHGVEWDRLIVHRTQMPLINAHTGMCSESRGLSLYLQPYFGYAISKVSGESAHMHRLAWAFDARWCNKYVYWNLVHYPIFPVFFRVYMIGRLEILVPKVRLVFSVIHFHLVFFEMRKMKYHWTNLPPWLLYAWYADCEHLGQNFFISWFTNPPIVIFCKVEKKLISKIIFIFYPPTLNIICFVEKNNIFLRFCLRIFESDTVIKWLSCPDF